MKQIWRDNEKLNATCVYEISLQRCGLVSENGANRVRLSMTRRSRSANDTGVAEMIS